MIAWARVRSFWLERPARADAGLAVAVALVARLAVVAWAAQRFPPADDGTFYHVVAERIARGHGYTWLWPDGVVTYAAHYPVGYPALVGLFYALFGALAPVAMLLNAALGTLGVWAAYRIGASAGLRGPALLVGLVAALHPGLVFYTPALMTEGVAAALLALLGALCLESRERQGRARAALLVALGLVSGLAILIRPQALLLIPLVGALAVREARLFSRLRAAAAVTLLGLLVCAPWTIRNCQRLERCVFVSANGGWNLYIGSAAGATGVWVDINRLGVPAECRTVFEEAEKDHCFGRAGLRNVRERPLDFLGLVPAKLSATFDWIGAPSRYLSASNSSAFGERDEVTLGVAELVVERLVLVLALLGLGRGGGPRARLRTGLRIGAVVCALTPPAWIAHLLYVADAALHGRALWERPVVAFTASAIAVTALTHAVFFGAGRYGLVCALALVAAAAEAFRRAPARAAKAPVRAEFPA